MQVASGRAVQVRFSEIHGFAVRDWRPRHPDNGQQGQINPVPMSVGADYLSQ
jgi:hypothetical protein